MQYADRAEPAAEVDEDAARRRSATPDKAAASSASSASGHVWGSASGHVRPPWQWPTQSESPWKKWEAVPGVSTSTPLTGWEEWKPAARAAAGPQQPSEPPPGWDKRHKPKPHPNAVPAPWHHHNSWKNDDAPEWKRAAWQHISSSDPERHSTAVTTLAIWEHGTPGSTPMVVEDSESEREQRDVPTVGELAWSVDWPDPGEAARSSPQKGPRKAAHTEPEGEARRRWCDYPDDKCSGRGGVWN